MPRAVKTASGKYRARIYCGKDANGKAIYASCTADTRRAAEQGAYLERQRWEGAGARTANITVGEAVDRYIEARTNVLSVSTISGYKNIRRNRLPEVMNIKIADITSSDLQRAANLALKDHSRKTVADAVMLVKSSINELMPGKLLTVRLPRKKQQEIILPPEEDMRKLAEQVRGSEIEIPVLFALHCGMRMSEVLGVEYSDIDGDLVHIQRAFVLDEHYQLTEKETKSAAGDRVVALSPRLMEILPKDGTGRIVTMTGRMIVGRFDTAVKLAGLPHMRFHDLRHYFASVCLKSGLGERYTMQLTGHSTPDMLRRYQHTFTDDMDAARNSVKNYWAK